MKKIVFKNGMVLCFRMPCKCCGVILLEQLDLHQQKLCLGDHWYIPLNFLVLKLIYQVQPWRHPWYTKLRLIRKSNFAVASKKIKKAQSKYKSAYDKKMNAKPFQMKIGDRVQYKLYKSKNTLIKKELTLWAPIKSYHLVLSVDIKKQRVILQDRRGNRLERTHPFSRIRKFKN